MSYQGCDPASVLQLIEETFDAVTQSVEQRVGGALNFAIDLGWNDFEAVGRLAIATLGGIGRRICATNALAAFWAISSKDKEAIGGRSDAVRR